MATCGEPSTSGMPKHSTRSEGKIMDFDQDFPPCRQFQPPTKLPTVQSVIRVLRFHLGLGNIAGIGKVTTDMAVREVAKQIYAKYYHAHHVPRGVSCSEKPTLPSSSPRFHDFTGI